TGCYGCRSGRAAVIRAQTTENRIEVVPRTVPVLCPPASHCRQRGKHILHNIVGVLEAAGEPHQSIADAELRAGGGGKPLMRRGGGVSDKAFRVAQIVADADKRQGVLEPESGALAALDLESDESRAAVHLPLHDLCLRM